MNFIAICDESDCKLKIVICTNNQNLIRTMNEMYKKIQMTLTFL